MALGLFKKTVKIVGLVSVSGIALLFVGLYGWSYWEEREEELEVKFALQCHLVSTTDVNAEKRETINLLFVAKRRVDIPEMVFYELIDVNQLDFDTAKHLKKRPIAAFDHFIVGIENSAPARKPVGQRAVIVFIRV